MTGANGHGVAAGRGPHTLAVDIGGTGVKASVLDAKGRMAAKRVRVPTPQPCTPPVLLEAIAGLVQQLPAFDRISLGFPGVVRHGRVITAPHFHGPSWPRHPFAQAVARLFGKPARMLNDAEVQGLGIVAGSGLEVVLTLGTGLGTAVFSDGRLGPHLELAHHPIRKHVTYDDYIGERTRREIGRKKWNRRVGRVIAHVATLLNYDLLYLGGGNSAHISLDLPSDVRVTSNDAGITGGVRLWDDEVWRAVPGAMRPEARAAAARVP